MMQHRFFISYTVAQSKGEHENASLMQIISVTKSEKILSSEDFGTFF